MTIVCRAVVLSVFSASTLLLLGCSSTEPFSCTPGTPVVADYTKIGTFQADTVSERGTTVTGSNNVNVLTPGGLGIVGGFDDSVVDDTESIRIDFDDSPVSEVSYWVTIAGNGNSDNTLGDATVEAFDRMGTSLGTKQVTGPGPQSVSTMFGDEPLSAVVLTAVVDHFTVGTVTYSPCK